MAPFISPEPVDTTAAIQMQIIETVTDIGGQICEDIQSKENQKSESEISFQVGDFTIGTGGGGDDDDGEDDNDNGGQINFRGSLTKKVVPQLSFIYCRLSSKAPYSG